MGAANFPVANSRCLASDALMTNPDLLILDEATEASRLISKEIWRIIRQIRESGIATVIVDKNHAAVTGITDRNVILVKGQVVFEGSSDELRTQPDVLQKHLGV
jgi:branched-chain amino acid transport system ATP-binding protein